jgi:hypothetical protein
MSGPDTKDIVDLVKLYIVNIALIAFLLIGVARLILEELRSLIPLYKKVKTLMKQSYASSDTSADLRSLPPRGAESDIPAGYDPARKKSA